MPDKYDINKDGWNEWAIYVLETLKELKDQHVESDKIVNKLVTSIKVLETRMTQRAALTGGLVGLASSTVVGMLIYFITRA
jgi:hypothetical protein